MWRAVLDPALDEVIGVLSECEHLILHFHGPVCGMPVGPGIDVASELSGLLAGAYDYRDERTGGPTALEKRAPGPSHSASPTCVDSPHGKR
jgi:hypothetical protein